MADAIEKLGRYELVRPIATGGMAELFVARFTGPGGFEKRCAVKRILPQFAKDAEFTRMFLNEARLAAQLHHPNLVQIYELGESDDGQLFIAMELVEGFDLRQLMKKALDRGQKVPPELAAFVIIQVLDGLSYAHNFEDASGAKLNLVHRDVSPQNILVSHDGAVKVVDFGIAKAAINEGDTKVGIIKGKVDYMSPEQAMAEPLDQRSDVFAAGICLYELVTGRAAFHAQNEFLTLRAILETEPAQVTQFVPDCPREIESAIARALEKDRARRYPSAREFKSDLQNALRKTPKPIDRDTLARFVGELLGRTSFDPLPLKIPRVPTQELPPSERPPPPEEPTEDFIPPQTVALPVPPIDEHAFADTKISDAVTELPMTSPSVPITHETSAPDGPGVTHEIRAGNHTSAIVLTATGLLLFAAAIAIVTGTGRSEVIDPAEVTSLEVPPPVAAVPLAKIAPQPTEPIDDTPKVRAASDVPKVERQPVRPAKKHIAAAPKPAPRTTPKPRAKPHTKPTKQARTPASKSPAPTTRVTMLPPEDANTKRAQGSLSLGSTPPNLRARLGARHIGRTPLVDVTVPAGRVEIWLSDSHLGILKSVVLDVPASGKVDRDVVVEKGKIDIRGAEGSKVYVNGIPVGRAPMLHAAFEGRHRIKVLSPDGQKFQTSVRLAAQKTQVVEVKF